MQQGRYSVEKEAQDSLVSLAPWWRDGVNGKPALTLTLSPTEGEGI